MTGLIWTSQTASIGSKKEERVMKKFRFISLALVSAFALLAASCQKEITSNDEIYRPAGSKIVFSVLSGYDNGVPTKAEYSGVVSTSNGRERIDWIAGDPIKIFYNKDGDDYTVDGDPTAADANSKASITGNLVWKEGPHTFYALYPNNTNGSLDKDGNVTGTIPATQNPGAAQTVNGVSKYQPLTATHGFMVGYKYIENSSTVTTVELPFKPAVTTFEFKLKRKAGDADVKVTKATLFSDATAGASMTGNFAFTISGGNDRGATWGDVTVTGGGRSIALTFPSAVSVPTDSYLDFSFLALPTDQKALSLRLDFENDTHKILPLKDNMGDADPSNDTWHTFTGAQKYVITNDYVPVQELWEYIIDPIPDVVTYGHLKTTASTPFTVTSYKQPVGNTDDANKVPVSWKIQYSTSASGPWSDTPDDKQNVNITAGGGGSTLTVNNGANVVRDHDPITEITGDSELEDAAIAALRSAPDIPAAAKDSDGYFDLSKHPVYGSNQFAAPLPMETANCYVIQRPGLYKFPLVYGNAIKGGSTNTASYDVSSLHEAGDESYFLQHFQRHDDQPIVAPWIKDNDITPTSAIIAWQDGTTTASGVIIEDASVTIDEDYVKFEVKRGRIRPGNVVIAVKAGNTVVWSWHIWVTEKDLTPHNIKDNNGKILGMMNYNLGWMDAISAKSRKWNDWTLYVKVTQDEGDGTPVIFKLRQIGDSESVDANVGSNTFYQWGRKDPMLPAKFTSEDKDQYSATGMLWEKSSNHKLTSGTLKFGHSIQHPNWQYVSLGGNEGYYDGNSYYIGNLWDSGLKNKGNVGEFGNRFPVKTVYDPCPPGFVVPYEFAFSYFGGGTDWTSGIYSGTGVLHGSLLANGYDFSDHMGGGGKIFFPFCGARAHDGNHGGEGTSIYDVDNLGYYWTTCASRFDSTSDYSGVQGRKTAKMMIMTREGIRAAHEQRKGAAYAVRPVLEDPEY